MRRRLEINALGKLPNWQTGDERLRHLALMEMYLDGKIYDNLQYEFDEESVPGGLLPKQIKHTDRRPSTRLNAAKTAARNVARKLFAGRHAPSLVLEEHAEAVQKIQKYLQKASVNKEMIGLVTKGSIGSACASFKIVSVDDELFPVIEVHKATTVFPVFDAAKQLKKLMIAYEVKGRWFLDHGIAFNFKGEKIIPEQKYFYINILEKQRDYFCRPIQLLDWNPVTGDNGLLKEIDEGELAPVEHKLGFVQAQWFVNLSGGAFPDGECLFEPALDNIIAYDYNMSMMDIGLKNAACPVTVIKGNLAQYLDESGKPFDRPATRYLHFEAGTKDPEGISEEGGDARLLETTGQGFLAQQKLLELLKKNINEQISNSRKDPDKVTTAMSGKGMELIEEEFMDLVFELRTSYGEDGYLCMVRKMVLIGIHSEVPELKGVTAEMVKKLELGWPDLHDMSPQEYQQLVTGIATAQETQLIDPQQAQDLHRTKVDVPVSNARKKSKSKSSATPTPVAKVKARSAKK